VTDSSGDSDSSGITPARPSTELFQAWVGKDAAERARATIEGMQQVDPSYSGRRFVEDAIALLASHLETAHHEAMPWRFSGQARRGRAPVNRPNADETVQS